jgi:xanthine dehydrogenase D subunit/xanthine dehydrogenase C subunit
MQIWRPASIDDVFAIMRDRAGSLRLAGGATALQLEWARGLPRPDGLIDLSRLEDLRGIAVSASGVRIGALSTLNNLIAHPLLAGQFPMLHAALNVVAGPSVRNLATLGGNIAGRTGCLLPALLALDARLEIATPHGVSTIGLAEWLAEPPQMPSLVSAVHLSAGPKPDRWMFRKIGLRAAFTPSVINVAHWLDVEDGHITHARLAVGGGVVTAARLSAAERLLTGADIERLDWALVHACLIGTIDAPDDDFRTGAYRRRVAANALVHGLERMSDGENQRVFPGAKIPSGLPAISPTRGERTRGSIPSKSGLSRRGGLSPSPLWGGVGAGSLPANDECASPAETILSHAAQPDRWHIRPDIRAKVEARLAYMTDERRKGMLVGRILRAGVAHARIVSIDTCAAEKLPGVIAVVTHRDIAGDNAFGIVIQDQPALCHDRVRHRGDPVAAVAAIDAETAERALALIRVEYEALPVVTSAEAALADDAPRLHAGGNLQCHLIYARGDVARGFAEAAHIVEDSYVTPRQMHGFMETEGGYAEVDADGRLSMHVGGQHGSRDRLQLSPILGLPEDAIRVVTSPTGGAFGGKDELTVQPALALLALKSGRPVRLQLSRAESVLAGQKRNPMTIRMKTACDAEGRLLAQEVDVLADAGAYASLGPGVLETALEHAAGPYVVDNVHTEGRLAYTNNGVCGAFRGFGANQMTYAIECQMDRLGALAGLDPVEIRARNLRVAGSPGYLGQVVAKSERIADMLAAADASPLWSMPQGVAADGEWIVGTGMALNYQGNGLGSLVPDPAGGRLALTADGFIEGAYGLDEMGQGLGALIKATLAAELGCSRDDVRPLTGDTRFAPESGSTTASRGTSVVWGAAKMAGPEFSAEMRKAAGHILGREADTLVLAPGGLAERGSNSGDILITYRVLAAALVPEALPSVTVAYDFPKNDYSAGNARFLFAFGAALARVGISRVTGEVRVLDLHQHTAAGPVMDVAAYLGQIEGGAVQGLGFTLMEDAPMRDGAYLTTNLDTYMLPGIADAPARMSVFALEDLDADDELGPRGSGELGIGAITPAIANAVAAAIGSWPVRTPFLPEDILDRLKVGG